MDEFIKRFDKKMCQWSKRSALNECLWVCADCSYMFHDGMPDTCPHNDERCNRILERDKREAHEENNKNI